MAFSYEWFRIKTRFDAKEKDNSEMVYLSDLQGEQELVREIRVSKN